MLDMNGPSGGDPPLCDPLDRAAYNPWVEVGRSGIGTPPARPERRGLTLARLSALLRRTGIQRGRVAGCGAPLYPVRQQDAEVRLMVRAGSCGGRGAYWAGIETCGSTWACPQCSSAIRSKRGAQVCEAVRQHGAALCRMLTVTVRHQYGHALKPLADGLQQAYSAMQRGTPWKRWKAHVGLEHTVRGWEVTHGANGWHPHIHSLFFFKKSGDDLDTLLHTSDLRWGVVRDVGRGEFEWQQKPSRASWVKLEKRGWSEATPWQWLVARWQSCVVASLGADQRPNCVNGANLSAVNDGAYLTKLGLELADVGFKEGRKSGSRTPMQIAEDLVASPADRVLRALWIEFAAAFEGRRQLVWSQVPRSFVNAEGEARVTSVSSYHALVGRLEGSDDSLAVESVELAQDDVLVADPVVFFSLPWPQYEWLHREGLSTLLLCLVEQGGSPDELEAWVQRRWRASHPLRDRRPLFIGPDAYAA